MSPLTSSFLNTLPPEFINRIVHIHGEAGKIWLDKLPDLRASLFQRWSLKVGSPIPQLSYNYLETVRDTEGNDLVLKIGLPDPEIRTEINALRAYKGKNAVQLFDADAGLGALLLKRVFPGDNLLSIRDDQKATQIAGLLMGSLWIEPPEENIFPTMDRWCRGFARYRTRYPGTRGPLPADQVKRAERITAELLQSKEDAYLLHGDLHHMNILLAEGGKWTCIDPKGVIGEACFEVGPLLSNPLPGLLQQPDLEALLSRRLNILAETLTLESARMAAWSYVRSVLSAIWSVEDGEESWSYWITLAEYLGRQLP